jgi:hypothetical protein
MNTATVEVLTAEVRTLMVGSRQITLSVYRQLDHVDIRRCDPFGRVNDPQDGGGVNVVGRDTETGALVRSTAHRPRRDWWDTEEYLFRSVLCTDWSRLPLIVLAGLR